MNTKELFSSKFFLLGEKTLTPEQLEWYCRYWWLVQYRFTLGLGMLAGKVMERMCDEIEAGNLDKIELWEDIFKSQAPSIVDEMGFGDDPFGLMHHNLFLEQVCATTTISREDLIQNPIKLPANTALAQRMKESFSSVVSGLCMMYVVEKISPELFPVQRKIFVATGAPTDKLHHSVLHESLEKQHAAAAENFLFDSLSLLSLKGETSDEEIKFQISTNFDLWKDFLDQVYEELK